MKYIMLEQEIGGINRKIPIIFPDILIHDEVRIQIVPMLWKHYKGKEVKVVSAGDIKILCDSVSGKSTTLNIESNLQDKQIINMYDYLHGIA